MDLQIPLQPYEWTFRRVVWATLVFISVILGFWIVYRFNQVIFTLFIAIVIGTVIKPAIGWLNQRGISRVVAIIFIYVVLLSMIVSFVWLLLPFIFEQGTMIAKDAPAYYQSLREEMFNYPNQIITHVSELLPSTLPSIKPAHQTGEDVMASAGQALEYIKIALRIIFTIIVVLTLAFYWMLDGPRAIQSFLLLIPQAQRVDISELISTMETKVRFFIVGQGILCLVVSILSLIAYLIIGLPHALPLALIAGVFEAVPMIGPILGAIPALMVAFSIGSDKLIWVIVATAFIQQLENSFLVPRIMNRAVGVNPFVTLLAIFAFSSMFGISGAFMAIPIAAIIQILLERFVFHPAISDPEISDGRDYTSRLRYEAQDLAQDLRKQARLKKGGTDLRVKQIDHVMDEIETITTDLDALLAQSSISDTA